MNIIKKLFLSDTVKKITENVFWQTVDKIIRLVAGLFVGLWVARYFGVEMYGKLNYSIAYVSLFGAFATLGLDNIAIKNIVEEPQKIPQIIGSAIFLKILGGLILCIVASISILWIRPEDRVVHIIVFILSIGTIFQAFNAIDFYYYAKVQAKYSMISKNAAFLIVTGIKIYLLLNRASLIQFAILGSLEILLSSLFLVISYIKSKELIKQWRVSRDYCTAILKQSWPLILSGFVIMVYMRIDQIMLGNMIGDDEVGIYSAAVRISEIWYFIPIIIANSVYPNLIKIKGSKELFEKRYLMLFRLMNCITIPVALIMTFSSNFVINLLYGEAYIASGTIFSIHIWAGIFVFLGVAAGGFYTIENLMILSFRRTLLGAIINVCLNFLLIPLFGGTGAAISTLFAQFTASYFVEIFSKKTRILFILKSKSFLFIKV
ncbi:MAG: flippase [Bacteroidales bacterium]|jgi:PST family polysaccharide transporter|nr:flippase [Bacteroidales bacterium]